MSPPGGRSPADGRRPRGWWCGGAAGADVSRTCATWPRPGRRSWSCPALAGARRLSHRLRVDGGRGRGGRGAGRGVGPGAGLAAVVVLDEHDEGCKEEQAPTWHARDVVVERARRAGVPCALLSPCPTLEALAVASAAPPSAADERAGWPIVDVVDRRREDPRAGLSRPAGAALARRTVAGSCASSTAPGGPACWPAPPAASSPAASAAARPSRSRRPACCAAAAAAPSAPWCAACGGGRMKNLRVGVSRAREELEALAGEPVAEVARPAPASPWAPRRCCTGSDGVGVVAFLDFDQELLAPRYRAAEQALALFARAARLLGGRAGRPAGAADPPAGTRWWSRPARRPRRLTPAERDARRCELPAVHGAGGGVGPGGPGVRRGAGAPPASRCSAPTTAAGSSAPPTTTLCDALAATPRPPGRVRVEVDPLRV